MQLLTTIAGAAGVLALASGSPAAAAGPPVSVVACDYSSVHGEGGLLIPASAPFQTANLSITFVNHAALPATDVRFAVRYFDHTQTLDDTGTFAPGMPITQDFAPATDLEYNGSAACTVQSVTFSDGSTWQPA